MNIKLVAIKAISALNSIMVGSSPLCVLMRLIILANVRNCATKAITAPTMSICNFVN